MALSPFSHHPFAEPLLHPLAMQRIANHFTHLRLWLILSYVAQPTCVMGVRKEVKDVSACFQRESFLVLYYALFPQNPMWRGLDPSDFRDMESSPGECVIFVVRVWNCKNKDRHKLVFQSIMDLNRLGYVGSNVRTFSRRGKRSRSPAG